ncbi:uncharacterized protein MYCGRDRAFT_96867 [Zymoseptoria tritici IPO323]|uniref:Uncharacterized protein n=1 Tax=Zymoseptoria tritici (strain CBS 115943 / IPO323) TaxID=336722 RepID=F9XMD5_ZYMTI|nr:uncharacterized protein MYCGRDRAFT_96867 [Zymoseptoria tritici IPO323]EGP83464.1 hypothetical protein MYCGRDRAFT_96867 [Zymoseptoria tritici IPO323]
MHKSHVMHNAKGGVDPRDRRGSSNSSFEQTFAPSGTDNSMIGNENNDEKKRKRTDRRRCYLTREKSGPRETACPGNRIESSTATSLACGLESHPRAGEERHIMPTIVSPVDRQSRQCQDHAGSTAMSIRR